MVSMISEWKDLADSRLQIHRGRIRLFRTQIHDQLSWGVMWLRSRILQDIRGCLSIQRLHRGIFVPGLVVILCVASGYTEVFGKIKAAPPADKRKDKTREDLLLWLSVSATVPRLLCPMTAGGGGASWSQQCGTLQEGDMHKGQKQVLKRRGDVTLSVSHLA